RELAALVGEANVDDSPAVLQAGAVDGVVPRFQVSPGTPEEVAAVLKFCRAQDLAVVPSGGHTAQFTGRVPAPVDVLLRTRRLQTTEHFDPGDLTIGVGAGTSMADLHARLASHKLVLPVMVPFPERSTIGGVLA